MDEVIFGPGSVPVAVAARVFGKDACWVRAGIITGYLNIGTATRNAGESRSGDIDDDIYSNIVTHNATCWNRNVCGRLYFYWLICQSKI